MRAEPDARHSLFDRALQRAEWSLQQLWLHVIATGGTASAFDLDAFLHGLAPLDPGQQDVLATALNERLGDLYAAATIPYLVTPATAAPLVESPLAVLHELVTTTGRDQRPTT